MTSLLYVDTAHFYWSFDGAQQLASRADTGENFYTPWLACNNSMYMATYPRSNAVRIKNTGTTAQTINRCEKWPPFKAAGYFDLVVETPPFGYKNPLGDNINLFNVDASRRLCSQIQNLIYDVDPAKSMSSYYSDLRAGLFDGNCFYQEPCQRMVNTEDCMVLNLNPAETDETKKECIYIGNFDTNPEKFWQEKCLINPSKCEDNGFTVSMWIKYNYTWLIEPNKLRFLLGTDYGDNVDPGNTTFFRPDMNATIGWSLWHYTDDTGQHYLKVIVTDVNYIYIQDVVITDASGIIWPANDETATSFWTNIGFRWQRRIPDPKKPLTNNDYYIDVYLYGRKCEKGGGNYDDELGCVLIPNQSPNITVANKTGTYENMTWATPGYANSTGIYIGCQGNRWGTNRLHYTSAVVDDVAFWAWRLRDEEIPYLLGGKAMPKTNINPNRAKSVSIPPEPVNPFLAMADIFYKLYVLDFTTTNGSAYKAGPYMVGPVEALYAPTGSVNKNFPGRADPRGSYVGIDSTLVKATFGTQLLNSSSFFYVDPRSSSGAIVADCPHTLDDCKKGFSLGIYVFIPATASLRVMNDHYTIIQNIDFTNSQNSRKQKTWELYTEGNRVFVRVGATTAQFPGDCTPMLGRWTNLGFSWRSDFGIQTYINGLSQPAQTLYPQLSVPTVMGSPAVKPNPMHAHAKTVFRQNDIIIGSDGALSSSLAGMALNDLAIFRTYIYPFETYKFMGLSEKESVVLWNATQVWSTDYFVVRDRALYWNKMGGMWLLPETGMIKINIPGADLKGKTLMTMNTSFSFLGLRDPLTNSIYLNESLSCIVNPFKCDSSGATFGLYVFINQSITFPGRHEIITTGNVDDHTIGFAIWLEVDTVSVPNKALFVELSRYNSDFNSAKSTDIIQYAYWRLSIPAIDISAMTWYHFSITWSLDAGLYFFINGVVRGWASRSNGVGVDSIRDAKPPWRMDNRILLGVNSFYQSATNHTGWIAFENLAVYHKLVPPLEVPKYFGLIENPWYGTATAWFDRYHLISNWQQQLYDIRLAIAKNYVSSSVTDGYSYGVTLTPLSARFNTPQSMAPLMAVPHNSWGKNFTVAIWVKFRVQTGGQVLFATDKYFGGNGGVVIRTTSVGLDIPPCSANQANGVVALWKDIINRWINVVVSYNIINNVASCWINGLQSTGSLNGQTGAPAMSITPTVAPTSSEPTSIFVVGGLEDPSGKMDFEVYQLAIYPFAVTDIAELGLMMGMPQQEAMYLITSTYYWSFSGPAHDLFVPLGSLQLPVDASYDIDRRFQGRAVKTSASSKSCVNLGNFANTCLTNITLCSKTGFVLSMWIKLVSLNTSGHIFSTGGQQPGEPGMYVSLNQGILGVGVSNGTYLWSRSRIYIAITDLWFLLTFRWNSTLGLEVYINGQLQTDDVALGSAAPIRNAQPMYLFTNATLGCSNSDMSKVLPVVVDDIWFQTNYSFISLTTDDCPASAQYRNVFMPQMMDQTASVPPYNSAKRTWATPVYEIIYPPDWKAGTAMDLDKQCPGDLTKCPNGFTISFWFYLPMLVKFTKPLIQLRSSNTHGFFVVLENDKMQQSLRVEVRNQTSRWLVTVADYVETKKWLQITAAWNTRQLTVYTLNRQYAPVSSLNQTGSTNDWSNTYSIGVTLDSGVWQYYVEDITIWNRYLDNLKAYPMGVSCVAIASDYIPDDIPTPPILTSLLIVTGVCYLASEDGRSCVCTKEQWDRGAVQNLKSDEYFKILVMLQGKSASSSNSDDLGIAKYQPLVSIDDLLALKKQIMNGAIMTLTDRTKSGLSKTAYDFVQLCSSVLYPIRSKETWEALAEQGDSAMGVAQALEVFGGKVIANMLIVELFNDTMNLNNSIDIHADNILFTAEVLMVTNGKLNYSSSYTFPNYERFKLQSVSFVKKWGLDDTVDSIVISSITLSNIKSTKGFILEKVTVVAMLYDTMGKMVPPVLDTKCPEYRSDVKSSEISMISRILSMTFNPPIVDDPKNEIIITLQHQTEVTKGKTCLCAFYTKDRTWDTTGCQVINCSAWQTICKCTHLTNFAILMQPVPFETKPIDGLILSILSYVGLIISMLALLTLFYLFVSKSKLHNERNTIHINLVVALFLANLFFLFTGPAAYFRLFCRACAALMHYFYTATFMWLLMEGTYLFNAVVSGVLKGRLCCMIPLAWGVPVLVVAGVLAVDTEAYGGDDRCWLSFDKGFIFAFIGPIILIVILNAALLGLIVYNMPNTVLKRDTKFYSKVLRGIRHAAVLLPLFGVTWLFGLFAVNQSLIFFQYLFVIFNSLQGFFIFLGFGWFQPDVRRYMCSRDDDMEDEDDPHKDVVNSESDLKTILSTMPPPTPELDRKSPLPVPAAPVASFAVSETGEPVQVSPPGSANIPPAMAQLPPSARMMSAAASARARTSFLRPATSLMRPKSAFQSGGAEPGEYNTEEDKVQAEDDAMKARELMEYLLDGKRVKDVPDFASAPKSRAEPTFKDFQE